jgi:hypothetical protein
VGTDIAVTLIIRQDEDDVRLLRGRGESNAGSSHQKSEGKEGAG